MIHRPPGAMCIILKRNTQNIHVGFEDFRKATQYFSCSGQYCHVSHEKVKTIKDVLSRLFLMAFSIYNLL